MHIFQTGVLREFLVKITLEISFQIRKLNHDPARLLHLLYAVDSLLHNKIVFLECQPYVSHLYDMLFLDLFMCFVFV